MQLYNDLEEAIIMQKILLLFTLIAIVLSLRGCNHQVSNKLWELDENIEYCQYPDIIFKTEKEVYSVNEKTIKYSFVYTGTEEDAVGEYFALHIKKDGVWKAVAYNRDVAFFDMAWILEPNIPRNCEENLEEYYNLPLEPGEYRIACEELVSETFFIE